VDQRRRRLVQDLVLAAHTLVLAGAAQLLARRQEITLSNRARTLTETQRSTVPLISTDF
jgi:hypothetical protein